MIDGVIMMKAEVIDKKGNMIDVARICISDGEIYIVQDWNEKIYFPDQIKSIKLTGDLK